VLLLGASGVVAAEDAAPSLRDEAWDIRADSISYDRERDVYTARGNVSITQPGRSLTAIWKY
jgi:lipopolysaccharide export system protein LptA